jgi:hypothetical protein
MEPKKEPYLLMGRYHPMPAGVLKIEVFLQKSNIPSGTCNCIYLKDCIYVWCNIDHRRCQLYLDVYSPLVLFHQTKKQARL